MDQDCNVFPRLKKMGNLDEREGLRWVSISCTVAKVVQNEIDFTIG
jgi:hypothetical protein